MEALRDDVARQRTAIATAAPEARSFLLEDSHVCLVEALGDRILADTLRDLTAWTVLISALHQSTHEASTSCDENETIVDAIAAAVLVVRHIGNREAALSACGEADALSDLRHALQPRIRCGG